MRFAVVLGALAATALALPAVHQITHTVTDVVDVYTTVYVNAAAHTEEALAASYRWWWKGHTTSSVNEAAAPAPTSSTSTSTTLPPPPPPTTTEAATTSTTEQVQPQAAPPTTSSSVAPAPAATGDFSGAPNGADYAQHCLEHHNIHRANNSAPPMTWDNNLASIALEIANSCNYAHNTQAGGGGYGQNIAAGAPPSSITSIITGAFYNGEINNFEGLYGQATPDNINTDAFDGYGHYTQIVWVGSTAVGCATVDCTGKGNGPQGLGNVGANVPPFFTVCNYSPPGNYLGSFDTNVLRPQGNPTIDGSYGY